MAKKKQPAVVVPAAGVPLDDAVGALLAQSERARHLAMKTGKKADPAGFRTLLAEARQFRQEADALDPQHTAAVWAEEQKRTVSTRDTHEALMQYYDHQLKENA